MASREQTAQRRRAQVPHAAIPEGTPIDTRVAERLLFGRTYYMYGTPPRSAKLQNDISDPPVGGWQHALAIPGEKNWTLFCPYTFRSYQVSVGSMEQVSFKGPHRARTREQLVAWVTEKWADFTRQGAQVDYDMAARVLRELGAVVPTVVPLSRGEDENKERGGKPPEPKLLRPVRRVGKRGSVLAWFLGKGPRSIREAMAEFDASRSSVLSYLHNLHKDHGVGYRLVGDTAEVELPKGCKDPWEPEEKS